MKDNLENLLYIDAISKQIEENKKMIENNEQTINKQAKKIKKLEKKLKIEQIKTWIIIGVLIMLFIIHHIIIKGV